MATSIQDISNIASLAKQLEVEIYRRHLLPGDRFMTAVEAGHVLGVSRATADRAMSFLARNQVLLRRRSLGTFVGPNARETQEVQPKVGLVYVCLPDFGPYYLELSPGQIMAGIREYLSDVNIQFCFYPIHNALAYLKGVLEPSREAGTLVGVVAVSCPDEVYDYLYKVGMPTVVLGSLYRGGMRLSSIDQDNHKAGQLLMQHLLDRGHQRVGLLTMADGRPGDHDFLDGISKVLSEAGLPHNALVIRVVSPHSSGMPLAIESILDLPDRPTAIISRHRRIAEMVETTVASRDLSIPGDIELVCQSMCVDEQSPKPFKRAHIKITESEEKVAALIGEILADQNHGDLYEPQRVVLPVKLCVPE